jgi:hypothetical protein
MSDQPQQPEESARPGQSEESARPASDGGARSAEGERSTGASTSAEDSTSTSPGASGQQSASPADGGASGDAAAAEPGADGAGGAGEQRSPGRDDGQAPLFAPQEGDRLRGEWESVQAAFVDDPRAAVQRANALVSEVVHDLTESFTTAQSRLEQQWSQGEDVSTEDLRQALHRYRSFFDRLLSL